MEKIKYVLESELTDEYIKGKKLALAMVLTLAMAMAKAIAQVVMNKRYDKYNEVARRK